jgi:glycosyltransferase involved in cell wall biosynthesis
MGGVRLRRIARLLPRYGWTPVVLTHPMNPNSIAEPGVRLEAASAPDLARLYASLKGASAGRKQTVNGARNEPMARDIGLTSIINRWLLIPDKQMPWYRPALRRGRELLRQEKFDLIFATLDPRTSFMVGSRLAHETGVPCVLEYRDLWTGNPYAHLTQPTALHRRLHVQLERKALRRARRVSAVCRGIADYLTQSHGALIKAPIALNYNFFDPEEYPARGAAPAGSRPFVVSYMGSMYGNRTPHQFFAGMRLFIDQSGLKPDQFQFRWAGGIVGIDGLKDVLDQTGVRPYLDFLGQLPHREALRLLQDSDAALLLQAPDDTIHIPGKLFEAMGARVPLLALSHPCEVAEIIQRCRAGIVCSHTAESVAAGLKEFYELFRKGRRWEFQENELERFSAEAAVRGLAEFFTEAAR